MRFDQIIVVKETLYDEKRVALTPKAVAQLVEKGYRVWVEENAGMNAGFPNVAYLSAGAKIFSPISSEFPPNSFIVRVLRPSKERELMENKLFRSHTAMLGFLFPFIADNHIATWQQLGITTLSFDLFKSISIDDPKNAQAAMSRIAGRLAFHDAVTLYKGEKPLNLIVIGAGAAGVSAAKEAKKHNIPVCLLGRKESVRSELESAGITYQLIPQSTNEVNFMRPYLTQATLVITAARMPGKKAPLLIDEGSLKCLPENAVIVDLAASNGGNVSGTRSEHTIVVANNVLIRNVSGYPKLDPANSSEIYAQCVYSLMTEIMSLTGEVSFQNKFVQEIWVTHSKQRHDALYAQFERHKESSPGLRCRL